MFSIAIGAGPSFAHIFDEEGIYAFLLGVSADETRPQSLHVLIVNNMPIAITLRRLGTEKGDLAKIERTKTVLWTEARQPVKFLRLSPAEQILMEPPDYYVSLPGVSASDLMAGRINLVADFGPDGQIEVWPAGPMSGMPGSPSWEPTPFQTIE